MQAIIIYTLSYASVVAILIIWRISQLLTIQARDRLFSVFTKWVIYTLILPRQNGSSDVSVLAFSIVTLFLVGNVVGSIIDVNTRSELSTRLGKLCAVNLVLLYMGGRTNLLIDKVLRLSMTEYYFLHRWIGRVSIVEAVVHGVLGYLESRKAFKKIDLSLLIMVATIGVTSVLYIRRRLYELFLCTHVLSSMGILALLWMHMSIRNAYIVSCLLAATSLFLLQKILWLCSFLYRNFGSGPRCFASVTRFQQPGRLEQTLKICINLKRPWTVRAGQYVYLSLPYLRSFGLGHLESHPFTIAWAYENAETAERTIVLLVECFRGFTNKLRLVNGPMAAKIDGPYGGNELEHLGSYDRVLFIASGIGIAHHLLSIRHLLEAHLKKTARVRRLTLLWFLETKDQYLWAQEFLLALCEKDAESHRHILNIYVTSPDESVGSREGRPTSIPPAHQKIFELPTTLNMDDVVEDEWNAEAGNMLVTVCGTPRFEVRAREAVRASTHEIAFLNGNFQPDETELSILSAHRYVPAIKQQHDLIEMT